MPAAIFTGDKMAELLEKYNNGWPTTALAKYFSVSAASVINNVKKMGAFTGKVRLNRPCTSGVRYCTGCEQEKSTKDFQPGTVSCRSCRLKRARQHPNFKQCSSRGVAKHQAKKRKFASDLKNKPCTDCGQIYEYFAMEFDHIGIKKDSVAAMVARHATEEEILEEVKQTEVVCVLCHRLRTDARTKRMATSIQSEKRRAGLEFIRSFKTGPCLDCGKSFEPCQMDFDHRDPESKKYTISKMTNLAKSTVLAEIEKCDLICVLCHRRRTHDKNQYRFRKAA